MPADKEGVGRDDEVDFSMILALEALTGHKRMARKSLYDITISNDSSTCSQYIPVTPFPSTIWRPGIFVSSNML